MRLFLALPLPDDLRDNLAQALERADRPKNTRVADPSLWHVTLSFLGEVAETNIQPIVSALSRYDSMKGTLTFTRFETFPHHRPRLVVAHADAEPLTKWQAWVNAMRRDIASYAPEMDMKAWKAHITVCRGTDKNAVLPDWRVGIGPFTWRPGGFSLMRSALGPEGPTYKSLHDFQFRA